MVNSNPNRDRATPEETETYYIIAENSGSASADYLSQNLIEEDGIIIASEENNTSADLN